ncbi:integrase core domain-containing protein [Achromobacter xylosoxidans]
MLDTHEFVTLHDPRQKLRAWQDDYDHHRPHGSVTGGTCRHHKGPDRKPRFVQPGHAGPPSVCRTARRKAHMAIPDVPPRSRPGMPLATDAA